MSMRAGGSSVSFAGKYWHQGVTTRDISSNGIPSWPRPPKNLYSIESAKRNWKTYLQLKFNREIPADKRCNDKQFLSLILLILFFVGNPTKKKLVYLNFSKKYNYRFFLVFVDACVIVWNWKLPNEQNWVYLVRKVYFFIDLYLFTDWFLMWAVS
jgi:hypothetical protein